MKSTSEKKIKARKGGIGCWGGVLLTFKGCGVPFQPRRGGSGRLAGRHPRKSGGRLRPSGRSMLDLLEKEGGPNSRGSCWKEGKNNRRGERWLLACSPHYR